MNAPMFMLSVNRELGERIILLIKQRLDCCNYSISKAGDIHQNVHLIRQTVKHIRACLLLIPKKEHKIRFNKSANFFKSTAKSVGTMRDLKVQYDLFKKLSGEIEIYNTTFFALISNTFRNDIEKELQKIRTQDQLEAIRLSFQDVVNFMENNQVEVNEDFAYKRINKISNLVEKKLKHLDENRTSKYYHEVRREVKNLVVQLSLFQFNALELSVKYKPGRLIKLGHLLGREHDLNIALKTLGKNPAIEKNFTYQLVLKPYIHEEIKRIRKKIEATTIPLFKSH